MDKNLLQSLYEINSVSGKESKLIELIESEIEVHNHVTGDGITVERDDFGNMYITKGDTAGKWPCFVAHLDEVHDPTERNIIFEENRVYAEDEDGKQVGIGADDKNGIYICLKMLFDDNIDYLKVAFFREEETGLHGSAHAKLEFFENCQFVIEPDAPGYHEFCIKNTRKKTDWILSKKSDWKKIRSILSTNDFYISSGGSTDVVMLKMRGLKVPCAEISAGYYSYHKDHEFTVLSELDTSLDICTDIVLTYQG